MRASYCDDRFKSGVSTIVGTQPKGLRVRLAVTFALEDGWSARTLLQFVRTGPAIAVRESPCLDGGERSERLDLAARHHAIVLAGPSNRLSHDFSIRHY